jgi:hypothetical protein
MGGIATLFLLLQFDKMIYIFGGGFLSIIIISQLKKSQAKS